MYQQQWAGVVSAVSGRMDRLLGFIQSALWLLARLGSGAAPAPAAASAAEGLPQRPDADEATRDSNPASAAAAEPAHTPAGTAPDAAAHAGPQGSELAAEAERSVGGAAAVSDAAGVLSGGRETSEQPMGGPAGHAGLAGVRQLDTSASPAAAAGDGEQTLPDPVAAAGEGELTLPNPTMAADESTQTLSNPTAALEEGEQPLPDALAPLVAGLRRTGKLPAALAAFRDCSVAEVKQVRSGSMCLGTGPPCHLHGAHSDCEDAHAERIPGFLCCAWQACNSCVAQ